MRKQIFVALMSLGGLYACSEQHPAETAKREKAVDVTPRKEAGVPVDTSASFRIGAYWVTPDSSFEFNTLEKAGADTLFVVTCQKNVIDPFGPIENKSQLKTSLLKSFSVTTKYVKQEDGTFPFIKLAKGPNKLLLYFDHGLDVSAGSYVFKGEITDSSVVFANKIRVGMAASDFYKQFFKVFPLELQRRYKAIVFDYCVDDIRHTYEIKNDKLASVKFSQPVSFWKVEY